MLYLVPVNTKVMTQDHLVGQAWASLEGRVGLADKARSLFEEAEHMSPDSEMNIRAWAAFEAAQGNHHVARSLYQRALQLKPDDAVSLQVSLSSSHRLLPSMPRIMQQYHPMHDSLKVKVWGCKQGHMSRIPVEQSAILRHALLGSSSC